MNVSSEFIKNSRQIRNGGGTQTFQLPMREKSDRIKWRTTLHVCCTEGLLRGLNTTPDYYYFRRDGYESNMARRCRKL